MVASGKRAATAPYGGRRVRIAQLAEWPVSRDWPILPAMRRALLLTLSLLIGLAAPVFSAERPRPRPAQERCTENGASCIRLASYTDDVCTAIEGAARAHDLDPGYFARLLWQESLFDAAAISPAGAQGIAQFMPGTAELRGLDDPFNPASAIRASAAYLGDLTRMFGNEGLAAAAYNSGEARTADFVRRGRNLPAETRAYVQVITGHSARAWRDGTPGDVDYRLAPNGSFAEACRRQAATRTVRSFRPEIPPWGVIVAAGRRRPTVEMFADRVRRSHGGIIGDRPIEISDGRIPGLRNASRLVALVVTPTRDEARRLCRRLQQANAYCVVSGPN